jgi:hypothetical protein
MGDREGDSKYAPRTGTASRRECGGLTIRVRRSQPTPRPPYYRYGNQLAGGCTRMGDKAGASRAVEEKSLPVVSPLGRSRRRRGLRYGREPVGGCRWPRGEDIIAPKPHSFMFDLVQPSHRENPETLRRFHIRSTRRFLSVISQGNGSRVGFTGVTPLMGIYHLSPIHNRPELPTCSHLAPSHVAFLLPVHCWPPLWHA